MFSLFNSKHFRTLSCLLLLSAFFFRADFIQAVTAQDKIDKVDKTEKTDKLDKADKDKSDKAEKAAASATLAALPQLPKGKLPVIIIPGIIGSELVNKDTNDVVWFGLRRSTTDDLRLPISTNIAGNRDNLVPRDILRSVKLFAFLPETEIYERLTNTLEATGGYKEGKWDAPTETGFEDTYYVFPYDWRRDNVENARLLIRRMDELKAKLKKPSLKFNIIAHSMGGIIARYAAKYGDADLPNGVQKPHANWAGAKDINKIFLVGTPNEGSVSALNSLINGLALLSANRINLPFIQDLSKYDVFTIPAAYQLLPHAGTIHAFDENLKPLKIDLYNPLTWEKYGWTAYSDPNFAKQFSADEQKQAKDYFRLVLNRAKRLEEALDSNISAKSPVSLYLLGSDCKPTLDAVVIYRDAKKNRWETIFRPQSFKRGNGTKVSDKEMEKLFYAPGDSVVTQRSFLGTNSVKPTRGRIAARSAFPAKDISFVCEVHNKLTGNAKIQTDLINVLSGKVNTSAALTK
jgi:pimeloyl-ACP methyl ester carboxylesterase